MDYEKKYKEALETARKINSGEGVASPPDWTTYELIFPELKESEDERIKKAIIQDLKEEYEFLGRDYILLDNKRIYHSDIIAWLEKQSELIDKEKVLIGARKDMALSIINYLDNNSVGMCLSNMECEDIEDACVNSKWTKLYNYMKKKLEKQGEQKSTNKVEPKFKVGDWLQYRNAKPFFVEEITKQGYVNGESCLPFNWENEIHLWTIEDAKDGDVLAWDDSKCITLFKNIYDEDSFNSHGFVGHCTSVFESTLSYHDIKGAHPATKEQCDLLFSKMKEAGYEWDVEKKELRKIEQKPAEWSEEDEKNLLCICSWIKDYPRIADFKDEIYEVANRYITWLKSLKQRMEE